MSAVMLAIFAVMVGIATQYPPQARFMPMVIGIPGIVLCLIQLFLEIRAWRRPAPGGTVDTRNEFELAQDEVAEIIGRKVDFEVAQERLQLVHEDLPKSSAARREAMLWASFVGLVTALILFGFWATIPVFLLLFLRFYAQQSWRFSLALSVAATALMYLVFAKGLKVSLHGGFITQYMLDRL